MPRNPDLHVSPINDMKDHIESRDCWCDPKIVDVSTIGEEAGSRIIVVHNAMDGREIVEEYGIQ